MLGKLAALAPGYESQYFNVSAGGVQDAGKDFDRRRFARAVWADERYGLARRHIESNAIHRRHLRHAAAPSLPTHQGKLLLQIANFDSTIHFKPPVEQDSAESFSRAVSLNQFVLAGFDSGAGDRSRILRVAAWARWRQWLRRRPRATEGEERMLRNYVRS